ncbi:MAG: AAA family ATPase [Candidatus Omnitrophica bacterium]|nr:AAA family ATPase [Candidatus Omnitrophota bacterium]
MFKKIVVYFLCITFLFDQSGIGKYAYSQGSPRDTLAVTSMFNELSASVAGMSEKEGHSPFDVIRKHFEEESFIFPFIIFTLGRVFIKETSGDIVYDDEVLRGHLGRTLVDRFGGADSEFFIKYDVRGAYRDKGSIVIPSKNGDIRYRFFLIDDKEKFSGEDIIKEWEPVELEDQKTNRKIVMAVRQENVPYSVHESEAKCEENCASGTWTLDQEPTLNAMISRLITSGTGNVSDEEKYVKDIAGIKPAIRDALRLYGASTPDDIREEDEKLLGSIDHSMKVDDLLAKVEALLNNPKFKILFLIPDDGEDKFSFLFREKGVKPYKLTAYAHFGHHNTKGADREENIYISAPYYDNLTRSDRIALIVHEMVHLILGRGDKIHTLADGIAQSVTYAHEKANIDAAAFMGEITNYLVSKEKMYVAAVTNNEELAIEARGEWKAAISKLGDSGMSGESMELFLRNDISMRVKGALIELGASPEAVPGESFREKFIEVFGKREGYILANHLNYEMSAHPAARQNDIFYIIEIVGHMSERLATEMKVMTTQEEAAFVKETRENVIDEVVNALFDEPGLKSTWKDELGKSIIPMTLDGLFPEEMFRKGYLAENREYISKKLMGLPIITSAYGEADPGIKKVFYRGGASRVELEATLWHEIIHHLGEIGVLKIDPRWEYTPWSVDLCMRVIRNSKLPGSSIEKSEERIAMYSEEYLPFVNILYAHGKTLGADEGKKKYLLRQLETEEKAAYFSIDLLVDEAILVCQGTEFSTAELKYYRNNSNRQFTEPDDIVRFNRARYVSQQAAAYIMAGMFMTDYIDPAKQKHPLRSLRDYFEELDDVIGKPAPVDRDWVDNFEEELENFGTSVFKKTTVMRSSDTTDRLGLWWADVDQFKVVMNYWPVTICPWDKSNPDRTKARSDAKKRGLGNFMLARYRGEAMKEAEKTVEAHHEFFCRPELDILWQTLLIPRSIFSAIPDTLRKEVSEDKKEKYKDVPELIQAVFDGKYDMGRRDVEKGIYDSYYRHLKYLDSILYMWTKYRPLEDKDSLPMDPRVDAGSDVEEALRNTSGAWEKIMFRVNEHNEYEDIFNIIETEILPEYMKLFEADVKEEKAKEALRQMPDKGSVKDPGDLTPEEIDELNKKFDELPDEIKEAIMQDIMDQMNSSPMNSNGSGNGEGGKSGQAQQGKPGKGSKGGQARPGKLSGQHGTPTPEQLQNEIDGIERTVDALDKMVDDIANGAQGIGEGSGDINDGVQGPHPGGKPEGEGDKGGKGQKGNGGVDVEGLQGKAGDLQKAAQGLGNHGNNLSQSAGDLLNSTFDATGALPHPGMGKGARKNAAEFDKKAKEVNDKIKALQDKINELKQLLDRMKEIKDQGSNPQQMGQAAGKVGGKAREVKNASSGIKQGVEGSKESLQGLKEKLGQIVKDVRGLAGKGKGEVGAGGSKVEGKGGAEGDTGDNRGEPAPGKGQPAINDANDQPSRGSDGNALPDGKDNTGKSASTPSMFKDQGTAESNRNKIPHIPFKSGAPATALQNIVDNSAKTGEEGSGALEVSVDDEFETEVDPSWQDMRNEMLWKQNEDETGLNRKEYARYYKYLEMLGGQDTIDEMKESFRYLLGLEENPKKFWRKYSGMLTKAVKVVMGRKGYRITRKTKPKPLKVSLLVDVSGSMHDRKRITQAALTIMMMLEVILDLNEDLESAGLPPIEFEVGLFSEEPKVWISHEKSLSVEGETRKQRLIYDTITKGLLMGGGWTDDTKAIGTMIDRASNAEMTTWDAGDEARRILFFLSDGNPNTWEGGDIQYLVNTYAQDVVENPVEVFGVSMGDEEARKYTAHKFGDRAVIPEREDMSDIPEKVLTRFQECVTVAATEYSWADLLTLAATIGWFLIPTFLKPAYDILTSLAGTLLVRGQNGADTNAEKPYRETGYKNFRYQEKDGKDWLVYFIKDEKGNVIEEYRWQRGAGGAMCPKMTTFDDRYNEKLISDIISMSCQRDVQYTSYSKNGDYYLRYQEVSSNTVELMHKVKDSKGRERWVVKEPFNTSLKLPDGEPQPDESVIYEKDGLRWKRDKKGNLFIETRDEKWSLCNVEDASLSANVLVQADKDTGGYIIFDAAKARVVMATAGDAGDISVGQDMKIDIFKREKEFGNNIIRLIGDTGLGKDELMRAAASLMHEEIYFIAGNSGMEVDDLTRHETIGGGERGTSEELYTIFNRVLHNGGWVVIDEVNKVPKPVLSALKASITNKTHRQTIDGVEKSVPNHPRARIFGTSNAFTRDFSHEEPPDNAAQSRFRDIPFVWRDPDSEKELQKYLAVKKLDKMGLSAEERERRVRIIKDAANVLVDIAWPMRLGYAGYTDEQSAPTKSKKGEDLRKVWVELMQEEPKATIGKNTVKAPSPRTILNIINHAAMFPETWKNSPLSVCKLWFNLEADVLKPKVRESKQNGIMTEFMTAPGRGTRGGIKDNDFQPKLILDADESFALDKNNKNILIVTPKKSLDASGQLAQTWDPIRIWIHDEASRNMEISGVPEDIRYWLRAKNENNAKLLYQALQARALGKSLIFVGDQSAGKSVLAFAIAELLDGKDIPSVEVNLNTEKEDLTFKQRIRNFVSKFCDSPVAQALREKKTMVLEESNQGEPNVMAVLNEVAERMFLTHVDGERVGDEGDGRAGAINCINTPGEKGFNVRRFSREYIERHAVLRFDMLAPGDMADYLSYSAEREHGNERLNSKIIGCKREGVKHADGTDKWDGFAGVYQELKYRKNKAATAAERRKLPPRVPSIREFKSLIQDMVEYWNKWRLDGEGAPDHKVIFRRFVNNYFVMIGRANERYKWVETIKEAFKAAGLYPVDPNNENDADYLSEKFLDKEGVLVQKLGVLREEIDTTDDELNNALKWIQDEVMPASTFRRLEFIQKRMEEMKSGWGGLKEEEIKGRLHNMRVVWQILYLVKKERSGKGLDSHRIENLEKMEQIMTQIIQGHLLSLGMDPESFLMPAGYNDLTKPYETLADMKKREFIPTGEDVIDRALNLVTVSPKDETLINNVTGSVLADFFEGRFIIPPVIPGNKPVIPHEYAEGLRLLYITYLNMKKAQEWNGESVKIKEYLAEIEKALSMYPLNREEVEFYRDIVNIGAPDAAGKWEGIRQEIAEIKGRMSIKGSKPDRAIEEEDSTVIKGLVSAFIGNKDDRDIALIYRHLISAYVTHEGRIQDLAELDKRLARILFEAWKDALEGPTVKVKRPAADNQRLKARRALIAAAKRLVDIVRSGHPDEEPLLNKLLRRLTSKTALKAMTLEPVHTETRAPVHSDIQPTASLYEVVPWDYMDPAEDGEPSDKVNELRAMAYGPDGVLYVLDESEFRAFDETISLPFQNGLGKKKLPEKACDIAVRSDDIIFTLNDDDDTSPQGFTIRAYYKKGDEATGAVSDDGKVKLISSTNKVLKGRHIVIFQNRTICVLLRDENAIVITDKAHSQVIDPLHRTMLAGIKSADIAAMADGGDGCLLLLDKKNKQLIKVRPVTGADVNFEWSIPLEEKYGISNPTAMTRTPDGKIIIAALGADGKTVFYRLNSDGSLDKENTNNGQIMLKASVGPVKAIAADKTGKISAGPERPKVKTIWTIKETTEQVPLTPQQPVHPFTGAPVHPEYVSTKFKLNDLAANDIKDMAIDSKGNKYILADGKLFSYDRFGRKRNDFKAHGSVVDATIGLAIGLNDDLILILNAHNQSLQVISPDGTPKKNNTENNGCIKVSDAAATIVMRPGKAAVGPDGALYFTHAGNDRQLVFITPMEMSTGWIKGPACLDLPADIAATDIEKISICDDNSIIIFDKNGKALRKLRRESEQASQLVPVDGFGKDNNGKVDLKSLGIHWAQDCCLGPDGEIFLMDRDTGDSGFGAIYVLRPDGALSGKEKSSSKLRYEGEPITVGKMAVNVKGDIAVGVSHPVAGIVLSLKRKINPVKISVPAPQGLTFDNKGNVYVITGREIHSFRPDGTPNGKFGKNGIYYHWSADEEFTGITFCRESRRLLVSLSKQDVVHEISLTGEHKGTITNSFGNKLNKPGYLTTDGKGKLFVANLGDNSISVINIINKTPDATDGYVLEDSVLKLKGGIQLHQKGSMTIGNDGNIVVADYETGKIVIINKDGTKNDELDCGGEHKAIVAGVDKDRVVVSSGIGVVSADKKGGTVIRHPGIKNLDNIDGFAWDGSDRIAFISSENGLLILSEYFRRNSDMHKDEYDIAKIPGTGEAVHYVEQVKVTDSESAFSGVAYDSKGNVYILEENRIRSYTPEGRINMDFHPSGEIVLSGKARGISIGPGDMIYTIDGTNDVEGWSLRSFSASHALRKEHKIKIFRTKKKPVVQSFHVTQAEDGTMYVVLADANEIAIIGHEELKRSSIKLNTGNLTMIGIDRNDIGGIAPAGTGCLFVLDKKEARLYKKRLKPGEVSENDPDFAPKDLKAMYGIASPVALTTSPEGKIYIAARMADGTTALYRLNNDGTLDKEGTRNGKIVLDKEIGEVKDLAVDRKGNISAVPLDKGEKNYWKITKTPKQRPDITHDTLHITQPPVTAPPVPETAVTRILNFLSGHLTTGPENKIEAAEVADYNAVKDTALSQKFNWPVMGDAAFDSKGNIYLITSCRIFSFTPAGDGWVPNTGFFGTGSYETSSDFSFKRIRIIKHGEEEHIVITNSVIMGDQKNDGEIITLRTDGTEFRRGKTDELQLDRPTLISNATGSPLIQVYNENTNSVTCHNMENMAPDISMGSDPNKGRISLNDIVTKTSDPKTSDEVTAMATDSAGRLYIAVHHKSSGEYIIHAMNKDGSPYTGFTGFGGVPGQARTEYRIIKMEFMGDGTLFLGFSVGKEEKHVHALWSLNGSGDNNLKYSYRGGNGCVGVSGEKLTELSRMAFAPDGRIFAFSKAEDYAAVITPVRSSETRAAVIPGYTAVEKVCQPTTVSGPTVILPVDVEWNKVKDMAVSGDGKIYILEEEGIHSFNRDWTRNKSFNGNGWKRAELSDKFVSFAVLEGKNRIYVIDENGSRVCSYDLRGIRQGGVVSLVRYKDGMGDPRLFHFQGPSFIKAGNNGILYLYNKTIKTLIAYDPETEELYTEFGLKGQVRFNFGAGTGDIDMTAMGFDSKGNVFVGVSVAGRHYIEALNNRGQGIGIFTPTLGVAGSDKYCEVPAPVTGISFTYKGDEIVNMTVSMQNGEDSLAGFTRDEKTAGKLALDPKYDRKGLKGHIPFGGAMLDGISAMHGRPDGTLIAMSKGSKTMAELTPDDAVFAGITDESPEEEPGEKEKLLADIKRRIEEGKDRTALELSLLKSLAENTANGSSPEDVLQALLGSLPEEEGKERQTHTYTDGSENEPEVIDEGSLGAFVSELFGWDKGGDADIAMSPDGTIVELRFHNGMGSLGIHGPDGAVEWVDEANGKFKEPRAVGVSPNGGWYFVLNKDGSVSVLDNKGVPQDVEARPENGIIIQEAVDMAVVNNGSLVIIDSTGRQIFNIFSTAPGKMEYSGGDIAAGLDLLSVDINKKTDDIYILTENNKVLTLDKFRNDKTVHGDSPLVDVLEILRLAGVPGEIISTIDLKKIAVDPDGKIMLYSICDAESEDDAEPYGQFIFLTPDFQLDRTVNGTGIVDERDLGVRAAGAISATGKMSFLVGDNSSKAMKRVVIKGRPITNYSANPIPEFNGIKAVDVLINNDGGVSLLPDDQGKSLGEVGGNLFVLNDKKIKVTGIHDNEPDLMFGNGTGTIEPRGFDLDNPAAIAVLGRDHILIADNLMSGIGPRPVYCVDRNGNKDDSFGTVNPDTGEKGQIYLSDNIVKAAVNHLKRKFYVLTVINTVECYDHNGKKDNGYGIDGVLDIKKQLGMGSGAENLELAGVTIDQNTGYIYVTDKGNARIYMFDENGAAFYHNGKPYCIDVSDGASERKPEGIGVKGDGSIIFGDTKNAEVIKLVPAGLTSGVTGTPVSGRSTAPVPIRLRATSLAVTKNNDIVALESGNSTINFVDIGGKVKMAAVPILSHLSAAMDGEGENFFVLEKDKTDATYIKVYSSSTYGKTGIEFGKEKNDRIDPQGFTFDNPVDITVINHDRILVADKTVGVIYCINRNGDLVKSFWDEVSPEKGRIVVGIGENYNITIDRKNSRILVLKDDGELLFFRFDGRPAKRKIYDMGIFDKLNVATWLDIFKGPPTSLMNTPGVLDAWRNIHPFVTLDLKTPEFAGITSDPLTGNIYVSDKANDCVYVLDHNGLFIPPAIIKGPDHGFTKPGALVFDKDGNLVVGDIANMTLVTIATGKIVPTGKPRAVAVGKPINILTEPTKLGVNKDNEIIAVQQGRHRNWYVDRNGVPQWFDYDDRIQSFGMDAENEREFVINKDPEGMYVHVFLSTKSAAESVDLDFGAREDGQIHPDGFSFADPVDVAVIDHDHILVADKGSSCVWCMDRNGRLSDKDFGSNGKGGFVASVDCEKLAIDRKNRRFAVLDSKGNVRFFGFDGIEIPVTIFGIKTACAEIPAWLDYFHKDIVPVGDAKRQIYPELHKALEGELKEIKLEDITFDPATGNLFASDSANDNIYVMNGNGQLILPGVIKGSEFGFSKPKGLTIDLDGNLVISSTGNKKLVKLRLEEMARPGSGANEWSADRGTDVDVDVIEELKRELGTVPDAEGPGVSAGEPLKAGDVESEEVDERQAVPPMLGNALRALLAVRLSEFLVGACSVVRQYAGQNGWNRWVKDEAAKVINERGEKDGRAADMLREAIEKGEMELEENLTFEKFAAANFSKSREKITNFSMYGASAGFPGDGKARNLILFADDILDNAVIYGLREALADVIGGRKVLAGGRVFLYTKVKKEDEKNYLIVAGLEKLIKESVPATEVVLINKWDHNNLQQDELTGVKEIKELIESVNNAMGRKGIGEKVVENNILAVIRSSRDWSDESLEYDLKVPLILMNGGARGIFPFKTMIELALRIQNREEGFKDWVREMLPVVPLVGDMYRKYLDYRQRVLTQA